MNDTVLLTGISGLLGGHVALRLLEAGYRVRGSVRDPARATSVREMLGRHGADTTRLEFVTLDLLADTGWTEAMAGVRYLQHVASPLVIPMPRDRQALIRPAVEGTRRAVAAALAAGVERIVLTSSTAAMIYGHGPGRPSPLGPDDWSRLDSALNPYAESKTRAERLAWELAGSRPERLAVLNPGVILGPLLDDDPGTSSLLVRRLIDGSVPVLTPAPVALADVRDVAELHVRAMTDPAAAGRRLPVAAETLDIREVAAILRAAYPHHPVPRLAVPRWLARLYANFDPQLRGALEDAGERRIDATAARTLLGRPFRTGAEAVLATAASLVSAGLGGEKRG